MSDSDLKEQSAKKATDLKALLQAKRAEHASQVQQIEKSSFESFESDLNGLLRAEKNAIADALARVTATFNEQTAQIQKNTVIQTNRMLWMLKLPLLFTAITCLAMVALCLLWFLAENRQRVRLSRWQEGNRTYLIVDDQSWKLCKMGSIDKSKTITVVLQPCKPLE